MTLQTYARLALVPTVLATGCPGDDASVTDSADSSSSSGTTDATVTQTTTVTDPTATTTMSTSAADSSSSGSSEGSSSTDPSSSESSATSSSSESSSSSEDSSTGPSLCGNGMVDGDEQCDGEDLNGADCTDVGFDAGTLGCNAGCVYDTFDCIIYICGNDGIDPGEFCDGTELSGADCVSEGFPLGGELGCNDTCDDYDLSGCLTQLCGNDTIEGTELCDGSDLAGETCAGLGYAGGQLGCNGSCTNLVTGTCSPANAQFTYVLNDTSPNSITAYSVDPDGVMTELPGSPFSTGGNGGLNHHPDAVVNCGAYLYAANHVTGDIAGFFVAADGSLTAVPGSPFDLPQAASLACDDGYLFASTLDSNVWGFAIADDGSLAGLGSTPAWPATNGMTIDPVADRLFVAALGDAISVFDVDDAGALAAVAGSPFSHGGANHSAVVRPDGAFVASEGNGGVRIWSVAGNGALAEIPGSPFADTSGCEVVGLAWAPDGTRLFVGHRACTPGVISVYDVLDDGALNEIAGSPFPSGGDGTVALALSPSGGRLFAAHQGSSVTSAFDIADDGTLVPVAGSPFANGVGGNHAAIAVRGGGGQGCHAPFELGSYEPALTLPDAPMLVDTRMPLAWDGQYYWEGSGSGPMGNRVAQLDAMGTVIEYQQPGFDVRGIFTKGDGTSPVYIRQWNDPTIYVQTSPGMWEDEVVLAGGVLDSQSAVVWDDDNDYYVAHIAGTVSRWDETGAFVDTIDLNGYGSMNGEMFGIENRGIAWSCGYLYTYSEQILSAWDESGTRVATTTLEGAGTSGDSYYAYGAANGVFWVVDFAGGTWNGYDAI